jgi:hypothetical protein
MMGAVATAAFAAGAAVTVFALGFALYAFAEPSLGRAGAAAVVAGVSALLIALGGMFAAMGGAAQPPKRAAAPAAGDSLIERALLFMQEKPVIAVIAAVGAGFLAIRNPVYVGSVIRSILGVPEPPDRR